MKGKPKRPLRGLALLGAASIAVVAAATVWLRTGWTSIGLTLTDRIGNAAQDLQGFTLDGSIGWTRSYDTLYFHLEDGVLQTDFRFDDPQMLYLNHVIVDQHFVLPPESRDDANDVATVVGIGSSGGRTITAGVFSSLRCMYTLTMPDGTLVRLAAGDITLDDDKAVAVTAHDDSRTSETSYNYDYEWDEYRTLPLSTEERLALQKAFSSYPVNATTLQLGNDYVLCWEQELGGRQPGLYRVHGLTDEEIRALPRDGTMYGKDVLCASTEFGTLTPFYCPADAKTALAAAEMQNGFTLLLYQNNDGILCADLVTSAGQLSDHRELGSLPDADLVTPTLLPRTDLRDAMISTGYSLAILRVENGKFTIAQVLENNGNTDAAVLNEAGDGILTAYVKGNTYQYWYDGYAPLSGYLELAAYDLTTGHMTYSGTINTGNGPYWENPHRENGRFSFTTLPQDRGYRA